MVDYSDEFHLSDEHKALRDAWFQIPPRGATPGRVYFSEVFPNKWAQKIEAEVRRRVASGRGHTSAAAVCADFPEWKTGLLREGRRLQALRRGYEANGLVDDRGYLVDHHLETPDDEHTRLEGEAWRAARQWWPDSKSFIVRAAEELADYQRTSGKVLAAMPITPELVDRIAGEFPAWQGDYWESFTPEFRDGVARYKAARLAREAEEAAAKFAAMRPAANVLSFEAARAARAAKPETAQP